MLLGTQSCIILYCTKTYISLYGESQIIRGYMRNRGDSRFHMLTLGHTFIEWNREVTGRITYNINLLIFSLSLNLSLSLFFSKILIFERERKGRRKRGRETSMYACLSWAPQWGPGPQFRHVPWLGIEPSSFWCAGPRSTEVHQPGLSLFLWQAYITENT